MCCRRGRNEFSTIRDQRHCFWNRFWSASDSHGTIGVWCMEPCYVLVSVVQLRVASGPGVWLKSVRREGRSLRAVFRLSMLIVNQVRAAVALGGRCETNRHQIVIGAEAADERVNFEKREPFLGHVAGQQFAQKAQAPGTVRQRQLRGLIGLRGGMFFCASAESPCNTRRLSAPRCKSAEPTAPCPNRL
jgi:hypothetical protein